MSAIDVTLEKNIQNRTMTTDHSEDDWTSKLLVSIKDKTLTFDSSMLSTIIKDKLSPKDDQNPKLAIISVIGRRHVGKSLVANYITEYFEHYDDRSYDWLKTGEADNHLSRIEDGGESQLLASKFDRFPPQNDSTCPGDGVSVNGVYVWPVGKMVQKENGEKLWVIILDVRFDQKNLDSDLNLFDKLSNFCVLSSSILIYLDSVDNWSADDPIQQQSIWTPGTSILTKIEKKSLQNCHYLLRAWDDPEKFLYGANGGSKFLEHLEANTQESDDPTMTYQHQKVRSIAQLCPSFQNFQFHLLPKSQIKSGKVSADSVNFRTYFDKFVRHDLDIEELTPVTRNGHFVKVNSVQEFFLQIIDMIDPDGVNERSRLARVTNLTNACLSENLTCPDDSDVEMIDLTENKVEGQATKAQQQSSQEILTSRSTIIQHPYLTQTKVAQSEYLMEEYLKTVDRIVQKYLTSKSYIFDFNLDNERGQLKLNLKQEYPELFAFPLTELDGQSRGQWMETNIDEKFDLVKKQNGISNEQLRGMQKDIDLIHQKLWSQVVISFKNEVEANDKFTPLTQVKATHLHDQFYSSRTQNTQFPVPNHVVQCYNDLSRKKVDQVVTILNHSINTVNAYVGLMDDAIQPIVYWSSRIEFDRAHEAATCKLMSDLNFDPPETKNWPESWNTLDELSQCIWKMRNKIWNQNEEIKREDHNCAESAMKLAKTKYDEFMERSIMTGQNIFTETEIHQFHTTAFNWIKISFTQLPGFHYTSAWSCAWQRLCPILNNQEKQFSEKNQQKIVWQQNIFKIAWEEAQSQYKNEMALRVKVEGQGKNSRQVIHGQVVQKTVAAYESKLRSELGQGDHSERVESLNILLNETNRLETTKNEVSRVAEESQNYENIIETAKTACEATKMAAQSQCKQSPSFDAKSPCGIGVNFSQTKIQVGLMDKNGFQKIYQTLPPFIAFMKDTILIGEEARNLVPEQQDWVVVNGKKFRKNFPIHFDLFDLLLADKNESQTIRLSGKSYFFRTEEILAMFLRILKLKIIEKIVSDSPSVWVIAISPFLHLSAKHMIHIGLRLAGIEKFQIVHTTTAMAMSYLQHHHRNELLTNDPPQPIMLIHSSATTFDFGLTNLSHNLIKNKALTGFPYVSLSKYSVVNQNLTKIKNFFWSKVNPQHIKLGEHESSLTNLVKEVMMQVGWEDFKKIGAILVVGSEEKDGAVDAEKIVQTIFKRQMKMYKLDEMEGIVLGATMLAAGQAGVEGHNQPVAFNEVHPYNLTAEFTEASSSEVKLLVFERNSPATKTTVPLQIQPSVSYKGGFSLVESSSEKRCWNVGHFYAFTNDKTNDPATDYSILFSPDGVIKVKGKTSDGRLCTEKEQKVMWMGENEMNQAVKKFAEIVSAVDVKPQKQKQQPPTAAVAAARKFETNKSAKAHENIVSHTSNFEASLLPPSRLQTLVNEVEARLQNGRGQGTSDLVRRKIDELIDEAKKALQSLSHDENYSSGLDNICKQLQIYATNIKS